jgi:hypothetical protein
MYDPAARQVKLLDFGIATDTDIAPEQRLTRAGFFVGTLMYVAPEALSGELVTPAADQYSLATIAYLLLSGVSAWLSRRAAQASGSSLALLIAIGIGLHNLGEGVAIGAAYSAGALALGAFLVIGFAIHNTTEGIAIVAPIANERTSLRRLATLGLLAGAPAVLGAWIGAGAYNPSIAAFLFGFGAGAIVQVIIQLLPSVRDDHGRVLHPGAAAGMLAGIAVMFLTGLLVAA